MAKKTIRVGFVGTGGIAGAQIKALKGVEGVEIVALADKFEAACEKTKTTHELPNAKVFTDWKLLVKLPEVDAIYASSENGREVVIK